MNRKLILAGVLGAVGMFLWSSVAHMVLPLGGAGIKEIPNEQALLSSMNTTLATSPGMYMFPALGGASMDDYGKKLLTNPSGLMIYHPAGRTQSFAGMLTIEFLTELAEALLAAYLLSRARIASFAGRVSFVAMVGLVAAISTNVPYWNWYGFSSTYTTAYMTTQLVGFIVAGLIAAWFLKPAGRAM
jgi:hypothetical protein